MDQITPNSNRLQIGLLGRTNSGKSSLINAITQQDAALVSNIAGTTTDLVTKAMEVHGIGPCLFIDTPGFNDTTQLGSQRIERTNKAIERIDVALLLCQSDMKDEMEWLKLLRKKGIPTLLILNKADIISNIDNEIHHIEKICGEKPIAVSALNGMGIDEIRKAIIAKMPENFGIQTITHNLVSNGDLVLLVMPQDIQAPKGRLILPQVQTLRELLDKKCIVMSCTTDQLQPTLNALAYPPKLIITDSQVFNTVYELKPKESLLTSFSVLFAAYKGDINYYVESAPIIGQLNENSKVLIAEACTHVPQNEDIGRVKLPRLLRQKIGDNLAITITSGNDFPKDLSEFDLIIQCGACMFNRKHVLSRIEQAKEQHIPMTNYGIALAYLGGILDKIQW